MSGKIELIIRKGKAKRTDLNYYPYWSWKITGEDNISTIISPTWIQLKQAIRETIFHELKVDNGIKRNPDTSRYMKTIKEMFGMLSELQSEINHHILEDIYLNAKK